LLSVQWINSWWWTEELSETCRVSWQNKFVKLVQLVGFITKKFVTMHGHMNVERIPIYFLKCVCKTSVATECCSDCLLLRHWTWRVKLLKTYSNFVCIHYTCCCNMIKSVKLVSLFLYSPPHPTPFWSENLIS